jgi:hypothetical protein
MITEWNQQLWLEVGNGEGVAGGLKAKAFNHRGHEEEQRQQKLKARGEGIRG